MPWSKTIFWIPASVADTAIVNSNGNRTLLANGLSTFFIRGKPVFSNGPRSLLKNPPNCFILDSWVFNNFILADEQFAKDLQILGIS